MELVDDQMCFVCGKRNPNGLQLDFELVGDTEVRTSFLPTKQFQGFRDIVHGGIITTILDEVTVNGVWLPGIKAVTGKLEVRLKQAA
ncbi:MAG: PaaI family thioesterase, partial [candidate division NC10 bacterium]